MNRRELARLGWREHSLAYLEKHLQGYKDPQAYQEQYQSVFFFASPLFQKMWEKELQNLDEVAAQDLLRGVMKLLLMPCDLSGSCEETTFLLSRIAPDCPPGSNFWKAFSRVVQIAFEKDPLADQSGDRLLKRQVHQLRYLLSSYQAQWIRTHEARAGQTDEEALQAYLQEARAITVDAYAAARLHNKVSVTSGGHLHYPSGASQQVNFKILLNFHTEYILNQDGQFLNEVDPVKVTGFPKNVVIEKTPFLFLLYPNGDEGATDLFRKSEGPTDSILLRSCLSSTSSCCSSYRPFLLFWQWNP